MQKYASPNSEICLYRLSGSGTLSLSMSTIQLPRNVQFLYEEHLARLEFEALGCHDLVRAGDHWDRMTGTVNPLGQQCSGNCPGIYQCFASNGMPPGICVPPCAASGTSCPTDYQCADSLHVCVPRSAVKGQGSVSASCASSRSVTRGSARCRSHSR